MQITMIFQNKFTCAHWSFLLENKNRSTQHYFLVYVFSSLSHWSHHGETWLICLRVALFSLTTKGKPPHTHRSTPQHTQTTVLIPPFFLEFALFRLFLFFSMWRRDSMTAFPAPCRPKPGERKTLLLTQSPSLRGSYHLFPRIWTRTAGGDTHTHTHTPVVQDSRKRETARTACKYVCGGKEDLQFVWRSRSGLNNFIWDIFLSSPTSEFDSLFQYVCSTIETPAKHTTMQPSVKV